MMLREGDVSEDEYHKYLQQQQAQLSSSTDSTGNYHMNLLSLVSFSSYMIAFCVNHR